MKDFSFYVEKGDVKERSASPSEARSLRVQAQERFNHQVKDREITKSNSTFIFEDAYEAIRQYLQSFMAENGFKPYSHEAVLAFALENKHITDSEASKMDQSRKIRNDIKYRGETAQKERTKEIVELTEKIIKE
jgi:hypothetical protein